MTRTHFIRFRNDGFWVFDMGNDIFLKYLIDAATLYKNKFGASWLDKERESWEVVIYARYCAMQLDDTWSQSKIDILCQLIDETCNQLGKKSHILMSEMMRWTILGEKFFIRIKMDFPTATVIELARAVQSLLRGDCPYPPDKTMYWFYGNPEGLRTLGIRQNEIDP